MSIRELTAAFKHSDKRTHRYEHHNYYTHVHIIVPIFFGIQHELLSTLKGTPNLYLSEVRTYSAISTD